MAGGGTSTPPPATPINASGFGTEIDGTVDKNAPAVVRGTRPKDEVRGF